jgi:hypothetical protein
MDVQKLLSKMRPRFDSVNLDCTCEAILAEFLERETRAAVKRRADTSDPVAVRHSLRGRKNDR